MKRILHYRTARSAICHFHYFLVVLCLLIGSQEGFCEAKTKSKALIAFEQIRILNDPANSLTLKDLLQKDLESIPKVPFHYITSKNSLWIVLDPLHFLDSLQGSYALSIIGKAMSVELNYRLVDGEWKRKYAGILHKRNSESISPTHASFELEGIDVNHPVYIRFVEPVIPVIAMERISDMMIRESQKLIFNSVVLGGLLFIVIINLFRWVTTKESIFGLYAAYVTLFAVLLLAFGGTNLIYYLVDFPPHLKFVINIAGILILNIMAAIYGIAFLQLKEKNPLFYRILLALTGIYLVIFTYLIWHPEQVISVANGSLASIVATLLTVGIIEYRKGDKYLSYYMVAYLVFVLVQITYTWIRNFDFTFPYVYPIPIPFIAFLIEALLLNIALNRRIDSEREHAENQRIESQAALLRYEQNQKKSLEEKVQERTEELLTRSRLLEESNHELKRVESELMNANAEVRKRNRELSTTLKELRETQSQLVESEKMASLGILSAGIGHEINNPLNFIKGGVEGLSDQLSKEQLKGNDDTNKFISFIKEGIERTSSIVRSLSHFSRTSDRMDEACDLHQVLDNCLIILKSQLKHKTTVVKKYCSHSLAVNGNEGRLHQAFLNILVNADQSIEGEGEITISTERNEETIRVTITDTGKGIEKAHIDKIMNPFFTTKQPGEGTGLGLAITYNIVEEHQGNIEVDSKQGVGTSFQVIFPIKESQ